MKVTIEFDTVEEALDYLLQRQIAAAPETAVTGAAETSMAADSKSAVSAAPVATPERKPRKPRADAGRPRGAYKPRGAAGGSPAGQQEPGASAPAAPAKDAKPEGASAPAVGTESASSLQPTASTAAPQAASSGAASDLKAEDLREMMRQLSAVPGKGMDANIATLKRFNVARISDLPKERYAEFAADVRGQLK